MTVFCVEDGSTTNWAEPESELGSLIPDTDVFGGGTEDFERSREAGQCCEDTAGPLLAGEAVANATSSWLAFDLNAQLSAGNKRLFGARLEVVEEHVRRENAHDLAGIMATFGEQALYDDEPWSEHHDGREAVRCCYDDLLAALPDLHIDIGQNTKED